MPLMPAPTIPECLKFMHDSKNAIHDPDHGTWFIGGVEYPEERAVLLAEYCLIIGSPLTSIATIEGALNQARRVLALEEELERLRSTAIERMKGIGEELAGIRRDCLPWYRRRSRG